MEDNLNLKVNGRWPWPQATCPDKYVLKILIINLIKADAIGPYITIPEGVNSLQPNIPGHLHLLTRDNSDIIIFFNLFLFPLTFSIQKVCHERSKKQEIEWWPSLSKSSPLEGTNLYVTLETKGWSVLEWLFMQCIFTEHLQPQLSIWQEKLDPDHLCTGHWASPFLFRCKNFSHFQFE